MKRHLTFLLLTLAVGPAAQGGIFNFNNLSATIPDGDLNGYQNSQSLTGLSGGITHVSVTLNISGGINGDLYAYLYHDNTSAILLNRVGRSSASSVGYPDAGFGPDASAHSFTLDDQAAADVHLYRSFAYSINGGGQLTGAWQPDGRTLDPLSPGSAFDGATRSETLSLFNGLDANGTWTLFVADVSSGGESTLNGWGLQITTVPEPSVVGLLVLGACFAIWKTRPQGCLQT